MSHNYPLVDILASGLLSWLSWTVGNSTRHARGISGVLEFAGHGEKTTEHLRLFGLRL
jgi:hypothetical protein